jgi:hypothetical protein
MGIKVQSCQALPRSTAAMVSVCRQVSADRPQGAPWSEAWPQKWHQLRRGVTLQAASGQTRRAALRKSSQARLSALGVSPPRLVKMGFFHTTNGTMSRLTQTGKLSGKRFR